MTIYGEINFDICSRYQLDISELFCAVDIVKKTMIPYHFR